MNAWKRRRGLEAPVDHIGELRQKAGQAGQGHVFEAWDDLSEDDKQSLVQQVEVGPRCASSDLIMIHFAGLVRRVGLPLPDLV